MAGHPFSTRAGRRSLGIAWTVDPILRNQGVPSTPALNDSVLVPVAVDVGMLRHDDLETEVQLRDDVPEQFEQPDYGGSIRVLKVIYGTVPGMVLRKVNLRRLIQDEEAWNGAAMAHEPFVKGEMCDDMATEVVLTAPHPVHRDQPPVYVRNNLKLADVEPVGMSTPLQLQPFGSLR